MQTNLLYLQNSNTFNTDSCTVLACTPMGGGFGVVLDITPFFPEGGGQPGDKGHLNDVPVTACVEQDGEVYHMVSTPFEVGQKVTACVDADLRMAYTQQHTGEHLLSYAYYHLFGADNVGFHISTAEQSVTIDLNIPLTEEQMLQGEEFANLSVWQNLPITATFTDEEGAANYPLRKISDKLQGSVRIVSVQGNDCCACCGTHFDTTAPVGLIKVLKHESYKGGVRITFVCGAWALGDYRVKNDLVMRTAASFSVKPAQMGEAVDRLKRENGALAGTLHSRSVMLVDSLCTLAQQNAKAIGSYKLCCTTLPLNDKERKLFVNNLIANPDTFALALCDDNEKLYYLCGAGANCKIDCKYVCDVLNGLTGGRGGGRPTFAQGSGKSGQDAQALIDTLCSLLEKSVK